MFDKQGNYLGKFGTMGHADGQLNTPLFVAISRLNQEVSILKFMQLKQQLMQYQIVPCILLNVNIFYSGACN